MRGEYKPHNSRPLRNAEIFSQRKAGVTYPQLASRFGVSVARARQIVAFEATRRDWGQEQSSRL